MTISVSDDEAKAGLSALISEVIYGGQRVIIQRRGKPLAALVSLDDLALIEREKAGDARPQGALALVGAWSEIEDEDIDSLVQDIYAQRAGDSGRPVELEG